MVECDLGHSKPAFWLFHRSQAFAGTQIGVDRDKKARFVQSAASQINLSKVISSVVASVAPKLLS
jgi:hypothetical protein